MPLLSYAKVHIQTHTQQNSMQMLRADQNQKH